MTKLSWSLAADAIRRVQTVAHSQRSRFSLASALKIYWSWSVIQELLKATDGITADVWVANDWQMLPLAARLADERGGLYVYDTHEFAVHEYMERLMWRMVKRPIVKAIETHYIKDAKVVSTVSEGIADGLQSIYRLPRRPLVIRNTPSYQIVKPALEGPKLRVLYHGLISPVRGLEPMIRSVKFWRDEFELTIRGPGNESYLNKLRGLIEREGVASRVRIEPPIPMTELISQAALFDVGIFCMPELSKQHCFVLPNKLFEYIMAGLAVCVSDLPEMSRIVKAYGVGVLLPSANEQEISSALNSLTRNEIRTFKERSLIAARRLCWEQECASLLAAYSSNVRVVI